MLQETKGFDKNQQDAPAVVHTDSELFETMVSVGFTLYTQDDRLAALFGVPTTSQEAIDDAEYWAEEVSGNVVLWIIQTRDAVLISKGPSELRDEGQDLGMLVLSREMWARQFPRTPYVSSVVQAITQELIEYRLWYTFCCQN